MSRGLDHPVRKIKSGFTLIEMLVVVAMLAILSVAVVLSLRSPGSTPLQKEAERLQALLKLALEQSRVGGTAIVWTGKGNSYQFAAASDHDDTGFGTVPLDNRLRPRSLPEDMRIGEMRVDAQRHEAGGELLLSGNSPPSFSIVLYQAQQSVLIEGNISGQIALSAQAERP